MKTLIGLLFLAMSCSLSAQAGDPIDRAESLAESPARKRLNEIQPYKPIVRRSRTIAIEELEQQLVVATLRLQKAEKLIQLEEDKIAKKADDAWTEEQLDAAESAKDDLEDYVEEAQAKLAWAMAENEKVVKFMNRDSNNAAAAYSGDDEFEDDDEDDDGGAARPQPAKVPPTDVNRPPRILPEISDDPVEDDDDEEDN